MNRLTTTICLTMLTPFTYANTTAISPGSMSTTGPSSNHHSLFAATHNPAMADLTINPNEKWRTSYFLGFGSNVEIGNANSFIDEIDELIDILDDPSSSPDSVEDTLSRFNAVLTEMGDEGYVKSSSSIYLPGLPLFYRPGFFGGTVFVEMAIDTQWRLGLLDSELRFDNQNGSFETSTAAYIKSGIQKRVSLGYGREIFSELALNDFGGRLHGGVKLNIYNLELSKQLFQLQLLDGKDIDQVVEDEYENHLTSSTAIGLDAGLVWQADRYSVGFTLSDINSPEFEYGAIGENCGDLAEGSVSRSNCELTRYYTETTGEIRAREVHKKHASASLDVTYFLKQNWAVSSSVELATYNDIVGTENQWAYLSTSYTPSSMWLPSLRVGLHKNLAGSELTSYGVGLTLFKCLSLDLAASSETVEHDGSSAPRRFSFSLSFEESF